jgi:phage repressor protein C with HTH and peptisase S24 domain
MLSHSAIWDAIDSAARRHGMSPSGLAKVAGLDPTALNLSKRISKDGRGRWPSTESLAKIMEATGESFNDFMSMGSALVQPNARPAPALPLLGLAQAGAGGFFDPEGFPTGEGWDQVHLPAPGEPGIYALEVTGDSMLPLYRDGDRLVVSVNEQVRRGDRVVVRSRTGEVMAKVLARQTANVIELHSLNPLHPPRLFDVKDVEWMARIVWASQ